MKFLLSPHDDDSVLFASFICMREKPTVVVCLDSYIQPARGEHGCSAIERASETMKAHKALEVDTIRLGLRDDSVQEVDLLKSFQELVDVDLVYAPAIQGGNPHHDMVGRAALQHYGKRVVQYTTYTKTDLYTTGQIEVKPTSFELNAKRLAMQCYESQMRINRPHFDAVIGKSEWLIKSMGNKKLHLGCGRDVKDGWINLDRYQYDKVDVVCDVAKQTLPFEDGSIDAVYSQDFLEHLPPESKVHVINEIWRVLRAGGTMEHFVPNAGSRNDYGSPSHLSHWNLQQFEHFDGDSYRWEKDRHYEGFIGKFKKIKAELVNWQMEEDNIPRAQSIHVIYEAVK